MKAQARGRQAPAQAVQGDPKVVAHPAFRDIPSCLFPLGTEAAVTEYGTLARALFEAGRLTTAKHRALSSYAIQFDTITKAASEGRPIRGSWFAQMDKARKELDLDDIDKPIAAPAGAPVNKFARTGFAGRGR